MAKLASPVALAILMSIPAHALNESQTSAFTDWSWPAFVVIPLVLAAAFYAVGAVKMLRVSGNARAILKPTIYFLLALISLVAALDSPLHEIGEQLFWVHMTQHEILMLISAPLLVLSRPLVPFLWSLSSASRARVANFGRSKSFQAIWRALSWPVSAWLLSGLGLWVWHIPWLFDQTLQHEWIHGAQHVTFLGTAMLFWWPVVECRRLGYGGALTYVFTTALHTSLLGAMLTFAPRPWYTAYFATAPNWNITALEDQQLGGLIMWIPAGTLLLIVSLWLLMKWMNESQARFQYTRMAELVRLSGEELR